MSSKSKINLMQVAKSTHIFKSYNEFINKLQKDLKLNPHAVPTIDKVVITSGVGKNKSNNALLNEVEEKLQILLLQKPLKCYAKISEANFQLREGDLVSFKVTLRSYRQWIFLEKLINVAIFKSSTFDGLSEKSIQKDGNYAFGIPNIIIFPEIIQNKLKYNFGFDINVCIKNSNKDLTIKMLKSIGFPIIK